MRKYIIGITVACISTTVLAIPLPFLNTSDASGFGSMTAGADGHGRGLLDFEVTESDDEFSGRLDFSAEIQHDDGASLYPDIRVTLDTVDTAKFRNRSVEFSGKGSLNTSEVEWMEVEVHVRAVDGEARGKADKFEIICYNDLGEIVFETKGELFTGDIAVNR